MKTSCFVMFIDGEKNRLREIKRKCRKSSVMKEESKIIKFHLSVKRQSVFKLWQLMTMEEIKGAKENSIFSVFKLRKKCENLFVKSKCLITCKRTRTCTKEKDSSAAS